MFISSGGIMRSKNGSQGFPKIIWMLLLLVMGFSLTSCNMPKTYQGDKYKVLVVMMMWSKVPNCPSEAACLPNIKPTDDADVHRPRNSAKDYVTYMTTEINEYYQNASFNQVYFQFDLLENPNRSAGDTTDGWWDSPYSLAEINKSGLGWKQLAMDIAYTSLGEKLRDYDRVLFISNMQHRGGQTCCLHSPVPYYSFPVDWPTINLDNPAAGATSIPMIVAEVGEDITDFNMVTVVSHELGHTIGIPDQYYGDNVGMGHWDIMHNDTTYYHFSAWTKLDRGWIDWNYNTTKMPCAVFESCEITTVLSPVEQKGNNALLISIDPNFGKMVEIDLGLGLTQTIDMVNLDTSKFVGIMAECRMPINGDENIPEKGVLVTFSNPYINYDLAGTISSVLTNEADIYALLQPGESYFNSQYGVRITNLSNPKDTVCTVKATRDTNPAPDLYITQGDMDNNGPLARYTSIDIWNDAEVNGWDKYVSSEKLYHVLTQKGNDVPVPMGYGDPIMNTPGSRNQINGMMHNGGDAPALNYTGNIYLRQPLGVTVKTEGCGASADSGGFGAAYVTPATLLASAQFDRLDPGQVSIILGTYQTESFAPMEVTVKIDPIPGELRLDNNIAYETYTKFFYETAVSDAMSVGLSDECLQGVPYMALEIPAEDGSLCAAFDFTIEPSSGIIYPGETVNFSVTAAPSAGSSVGDTCQTQIGVVMPVTSSYVPVVAFNVYATVMEPAGLTCELRSGSEGISVTGQLTPPLLDTVSLYYNDPNGQQTTKILQTLDNGQYFDEFTSALPGLWTVQAWWLGDATHAPTSSAVCSQTVQQEVIVREPPKLRVDSPAYCRQGPSTYYPSLGVTSQGSEYVITGLTTNVVEWYRIQFNDQQTCWVRADTGQTIGDKSGVEVLVVDVITPTPPPLIPTFTPTVPAQDACAQYTSPGICQIAHGDTCQWLADTGKCVKK
jgi:M6 family metalloprotease-like protein